MVIDNEDAGQRFLTVGGEKKPVAGRSKPNELLRLLDSSRASFSNGRLAPAREPDHTA
jgi:hypothetical protein